LVYMQNCQPTLLVLIDRKVKLVDLFKAMELLNNSYAFYMPPQAPPLSVNAFCIVTSSAHETPVYPYFQPICILCSLERSWKLMKDFWQWN